MFFVRMLDVIEHNSLPPPEGTASAETLTGFINPPKEVSPAGIKKELPVLSWEEWLEKNVDVVEVRDAVGVAAALQAINEVKMVALDTETTGLDPLQNRIRLIQLAVPEGISLIDHTYRFPEPESRAKVFLVDLFRLAQTDREELITQLVAVISDPKIIKIGHNLKFDLAFIRAAIGRRFPACNLFDTMLASQLNMAGYYKLVHSEKATKHSLKEQYPAHDLMELAQRHLGIQLDKTYQLGNWAGDLSPAMLRYAARDAAVLLPLYEIQRALIQLNKLEKAAKLEFNCLTAVVEMELNGIAFNASAARQLIKQLNSEAAAVKHKLIEIARAAGFKARKKKSTGKSYNPDLNPASNEDVLATFKLLGYPVENTKNETLSDLAGQGVEFAKELIAYREKTKMAKFVEQWLSFQHPFDDRIHPSYRQLNPHNVGRLSSSDPNLQQVPRDKKYRCLFVAPPSRKLVIADFSGIELRIMAWLANDKTMIEAFARGDDLHRLTAAAIAGKAPAEVTKEERQAAKAANFGLIYGCGPARLIQSARYDYGVNMDAEQARKTREAFFSTYKGVAAWHARQKKRREKPEPHYFHRYEREIFALKLVAVRTACGRKRVWPNYAGHTQARVTELFNTPDQGSGADIMKETLARVYAELLKPDWADVLLIASVHDEIILEVPEEKAAAAAEKLRRLMIESGDYFIAPVAVDVETGIGDTWADK